MKKFIDIISMGTLKKEDPEIYKVLRANAEIEDEEFLKELLLSKIRRAKSLEEEVLWDYYYAALPSNRKERSLIINL